MLISHSLPITEASDDAHEKKFVNITLGMKWIKRVDTTRQTIKILCRRLNMVNDRFKTLEDFTLEENDNNRKKLKTCKHANYEMKETITSWSVGSCMH